MIVPLTAILLLLWFITKKKIFGKIAGWYWIGFLLFVVFLCILDVFTSKKKIEKEDIYGDYIIDREKFPGKQADWQYNHYRYSITKDNKMYFYITNKEKIVKTIKGTIKLNNYANPRIELFFEDPKFHIIEEDPTLYREIWSFYYVFYSNKYQNVFFKKGSWKSID
ncbi:hypothetical protein [Flavobacterium sp.]|uniref:hypothetical protein n=1 Tax=Flavobacterium sp. TaxID=239 RepID=UPI002FDB60D4